MSLLTTAWKMLPNSKRLKLAIMRIVQDEFLIGVTGIILNHENAVLAVNHSYRDGKRWSLPGGYIKKKEHPREGLAREIQEETSIVVKVEREVKIRTDRDTARLDIVLVGSYVSGEFVPSEEVTHAGFFQVDDLPPMSEEHLMLIKNVLKHTRSQSTVWSKLTSWMRG